MSRNQRGWAAIIAVAAMLSFMLAIWKWPGLVPFLAGSEAWAQLLFRWGMPFAVLGVFYWGVSLLIRAWNNQ